MSTIANTRKRSQGARCLAYARNRVSGMNGTDAAVAAGYSPRSAKFQACRLEKASAVQAEIERLRAEADTAAIATRTEVMEVLSGVVRGKIPSEQTETTTTGPQGNTTTRKVVRGPVQAARLLSDLEGWTQPPGAGQQVAIQIVLDGRPAGMPRGPIRLGDGRIVGGEAQPEGQP